MSPDLRDLIAALLQTRDFCGNERETLREWQQENRRLTDEERFFVVSEVARRWNESQREAGVAFPLNADERRKARRALA